MEARDGVVEMSAEEQHNETSRVISPTGRYADIKWCMFRSGVGASTDYAFSLVMSVAGSHDAVKFGVTGNPGWRMLFFDTQELPKRTRRGSGPKGRASQAPEICTRAHCGAADAAAAASSAMSLSAKARMRRPL